MMPDKKPSQEALQNLKSRLRLDKKPQAWTPEPWVFDPYNEGLSFDRGWGLYSEPDPQSILARPSVAHVPFKAGEATGKRIVACVNSLAGVPDPVEFVAAMKELWEAAEGLDEGFYTGISLPGTRFRNALARVRKASGL